MRFMVIRKADPQTEAGQIVVCMLQPPQRADQSPSPTRLIWGVIKDPQGLSLPGDIPCWQLPQYLRGGTAGPFRFVVCALQ